jgi:hypothetical protein
MTKALTLARPFFVLLIIFTVVRLVLSSQGVPYENSRAASISLVVLTYVSAALTAALARGLVGQSLKGAAIMGAQMGFAAQVVIFLVTMLSIAAGAHTYFNYAPAINDALIGKDVTIASALPYRGVALIIGPITTAIVASIGWLIGGTMGRRA